MRLSVRVLFATKRSFVLFKSLMAVLKNSHCFAGTMESQDSAAGCHPRTHDEC